MQKRGIFKTYLYGLCHRPIRDRPKFMGYPGRVKGGGAKSFFGRQKRGAETFLTKKALRIVFFFNEKRRGHYWYLYFFMKKGVKKLKSNSLKSPETPIFKILSENIIYLGIFK